MQKMTAVAGSGTTQQQHFFSNTESGTSEPLLIPNTGSDVLVVLVPDAAATVQFTISSPASVREGTATWLDWDQGEVTTPSHARVIAGITALRVVSAGAYTWEVVA